MALRSKRLKDEGREAKMEDDRGTQDVAAAIARAASKVLADARELLDSVAP